MSYFILVWLKLRCFYICRQYPWNKMAHTLNKTTQKCYVRDCFVVLLLRSLNNVIRSPAKTSCGLLSASRERYVPSCWDVMTRSSWWEDGDLLEKLQQVSEVPEAQDTEVTCWPLFLWTADVPTLAILISTRSLVHQNRSPSLNIVF